MHKKRFRKIIVKILLPCLLGLGISSCRITKNVPEGDALFMGSSIKVEQSSVSKRATKDLKSELKSITRPRPNRRFVGIPFKLSLYNLGGKKGIGKWIRKKGEPPVLLSELNLERNKKVLTNRLENQGFFIAEVKGDTSVKGKKARAVYTVKTGPQYMINTIFFPDSNTQLKRAILQTLDKTLLKAGKAFNLDVIKDERMRIDAALKETGYYYFSEDYLLVEVDSTVGNNKVNLYLKVKEETPAESRKPYTIKDVFIYPNYNLNTTTEDITENNTIRYKGFYIIDSTKAFRPKVFETAMMFETGDLYNRADHNKSLNRLSNLGVYKFVKNRFDLADTNRKQLNAYYYLTPLPKKSLRGEINALTKSNNVTGTQASINWKNRNTFKAAEQLNISLYGGYETQYSGQYSGFNTYRYGTEVSLVVPRFIIPFYKPKPSGSFVPKTAIELGYEVLTRTQLYTLNSFKANYGYVWRENIQKEHKLNPLAFTYVQPVNISQRYQDSLLKDPSLEKPIERQFILGSTYNYNYNQLAGTDKRSGLYFNTEIDIAGNIVGLLSGANAQSDAQKTLFGSVFSQYLKTEIDTRYYLKSGRRNQWANRLILGLGYPWGNSRELPFVKQFFIGGNNSIRAFRTRSLGPGAFRPANLNTGSFLPDQSGDIKIEANTEYRAKIVSIVEGAVFVDAGNIWLYHENPAKPGAQFSKKFLNEFAVGSGIGLRLNLTILLVRLDLAFPLRVPYLPEGQRWVVDQINFGSGEWRKQNLIFNLAIGYPF